MTSHTKTDFAERGLAHDLNNVFQIVLCAAHSIGEDPRHSAATSVIVRSVQQALRILDEGAQQSQSVELSPVVDRCCRFAADFSTIIGGPDVRTAIHLDAGLRVSVRPASLERTLMNLLLNAVEAAAAAKCKTLSIQVDARRDGERMMIAVRDDGPGFPPGFLPAGVHPECDGLGLRIVQEAIRREGGTVTPENAPAGGAVFTLTLKADLAPPEPSPVRESGNLVKALASPGVQP